ncbi:hypothetical protein ACG5V6_17110 [Streptomyces chitinivorans]|uniref:Uncharacterized protein n=1 Tax=Streptomyces chitinivorans TaxID=1257027 RepID=A0ABW7HVK7_9ACTN|nr:hypothetical protein [Streptomyces chitinivorans]MDH2410546.1 hypothetical protein [Streptomyces chitinivorans]
MPNPDTPSRTDYAAAVESLADRVLGALRGAGDPAVVASQVDEAPDPKVALAAVRVLGPDVFAPALLAGAPFGPGDARAVAESLRIFPPAPNATPEAAWRDWTTVRLLARYGGGSPGDTPTDTPEDTLGVREPAPPGGAGSSWRELSLSMAQLSPLALPNVDGPVHEAALDRLCDLSRGAARAMLRRDYPTAARLARWLACALHRGARPDLDTAALVRHLELHCGGGGRTALDTAVARGLLDRTQPQRPGGPTA